jgi:hypothetical protein
MGAAAAPAVGGGRRPPRGISSSQHGFAATAGWLAHSAGAGAADDDHVALAALERIDGADLHAARAQTAILLRRRAYQHRWQPLVNGEHGASIRWVFVGTCTPLRQCAPACTAASSRRRTAAAWALYRQMTPSSAGSSGTAPPVHSCCASRWHSCASPCAGPLGSSDFLDKTQLMIEAPWGSKPLADADKWPARRLNNTDVAEGNLSHTISSATNLVDVAAARLLALGAGPTPLAAGVDERDGRQRGTHRRTGLQAGGVQQLLLRRRAYQHRWQPLVNGEHGASIRWVFDGPASRGRPAAALRRTARWRCVRSWGGSGTACAE